MPRTAALVLSLLLAAAGCGGATDSAGGGSSTTGVPTTAPWHTCEAERTGYALRYPADWHTNAGAVDEPCHWFDPRPVQLRPNTDVVDVAVHVRKIDGELDAHVRRVTDERTVEVLHREDRTVAGQSAVVVETRSTKDALFPAGTRVYGYYAAVGGRLLAATTNDVDADDYDRAKEVVDGMMASLELRSPAARCSADGLSAMPEGAPGLPMQVAATRISIVDAAADCDYERLAALAGQGSRPFTASFGGADDAAAYWRRLEAEGAQPLRLLVGLLDRPYAHSEGRFAWPSAYGYERWADVPEEEREALRPLYGDEDFRRFEQFGAYAGYRVGIAEDGEWLFFVAGD